MKNLSILSIILVVINLNTLAQTNYYVSTTGNNNNSGAAPDQPWQTIQYAANNVTAGDTVNIIAGTYNEKIDINVSGTANNYITFRNYNTDNVVLSGISLPAYEYLIKIENRDYIRISGLHFKDYQQPDAIGLTIINSSNIHINNNEFSNIDYSAIAESETPTEE